KCWHFEGKFITIALRHIKPPIIHTLLPICIGNADDLEIAIGKCRQSVTLKATSAPRTEEIEAANLCRTESRAVAFHISIKRRVIGCQCALKSSNGFNNIIEG